MPHVRTLLPVNILLMLAKRPGSLCTALCQMGFPHARLLTCKKFTLTQKPLAASRSGHVRCPVGSVTSVNHFSLIQSLAFEWTALVSLFGKRREDSGQPLRKVPKVNKMLLRDQGERLQPRHRSLTPFCAGNHHSLPTVRAHGDFGGVCCASKPVEQTWYKPAVISLTAATEVSEAQS